MPPGENPEAPPEGRRDSGGPKIALSRLAVSKDFKGFGNILGFDIAPFGFGGDILDAATEEIRKASSPKPPTA